MSVRRLVLYEDRDWRALRPLTDLAIVPALTFGASTLAQRWARFVALPLLSIEARRAVQATWAPAPAFDTNGLAAGDEVVVVNAAALSGPWYAMALASRSPALFMSGGRVALARMPLELLRPALGTREDFETVLRSLGCPMITIEATFLAHPWQLFERNTAAIVEDLAALDAGVHGMLHPTAALEAPERIRIEADAVVGPFAVLDAREGPILMGRGARIGPHTVVTGPCVIGPGTQLLGGVVSRSTFGPECRVAGEVEECVWQGYGNKRHHGFLGHSWVGEWANLGALTTSSDLKNNYGMVRVHVDGAEIDSGSRKVGSLIGAHVKTGIGTLLPTGASIGTGANLFGGGRFAPKHVASFAWWDGERHATHAFDKFLGTARIAYSRRGRALGPGDESALRALFEATANERRDFPPAAPITPAARS